MDQRSGGSIRAIPKSSVHRICTGQVVLDLATAVKELVENSIDAGAKKVDVRLTEYGMEKIEVSDNGAGVAPSNYESLALRHHTSKLKSFEDLESMETFGFRGEALSALASLGALSIMTRQADQDVATTLEFSRGGELLKRAPAARDVGTTVTVAKIFSPLPVRHQEFKRNIKKEFSRLHDVLAGYSLVARKVRLTVTNVAKKGGRQSVIKTLGNGSLKDTVSSVFGIRQLNTLQELHAHSEETGITLEGFVSKLGSGRSSGDRQLFSINSRPVDMSKLSRTCNEVWRQFTSHQYPVVIVNITMSRKHCDINVNPDKRQVLLHTETELRELLRDALTEVYAPPALSQSQSSTTTSGTTPSATSWLVPAAPASSNHADCEGGTPYGSQTTVDPVTNRSGGSGSAVTASMAASLAKAPQTTKNTTTAAAAVVAREPDSSSTAPVEIGDTKQFREQKVEEADDQYQNAVIGGNTASLGKSTVGSWIRSPSALPDDGNHGNPELTSKFRPLPTPSAAMTSPVHTTAEHSPVTKDQIGSVSALSSSAVGSPRRWVGTRSRAAAASVVEVGGDGSGSPARGHSTYSSRPKRGQKRAAADAAQGEITAFFTCGTSHKYSCSDDVSQTAGAVGRDAAEDCSGERKEDDEGDAEGRLPDEFGDDKMTRAEKHLHSRSKRARGGNCTVEDQSQAVSTHDIYESTEIDADHPGQIADETPSSANGSALQFGAADVLLIDLDLAGVLDASRKSVPDNKSGHRTNQHVSKFLHANLAQEIRARRNSAASADDKATHELARSLAKEDFEEMEVVGQFNRGFIIAKLREDLFIVDQHACDEKYNFETMQAKTQLHTQRMVNSMPLEVNVAGELVVMDHLEIMAANGFEFDVDDTAPAGRRLRLKTVPISKSVAFGAEDVYELISLLTARPGIMCRPSRLRGMFASRACRKAVMIGTALDRPQMQQLLNQMSNLEQPWNCPHGRPTMRHLCNVRSSMTPTSIQSTEEEC